ncbi:hypothetical protein BDF20DRAFT_910016 [Mycotypha africana]|uniref:uncharacterized protein n=1 Tax=Mycotypha africana TaxID=64632 RepID=UPI0023011A07|nr:uncharacterized protein BDF20DRAFT_910016 [Mycotypha africana]KAI8987387.1 hypothetical protein BDF20DRAFT_910016 [Mycotypha africana]
MAHSTEDQSNIQWDILQASDPLASHPQLGHNDNAEILDPLLSDLTIHYEDSTAAELSAKNTLNGSNLLHVDISDKKPPILFDHDTQQHESTIQLDSVYHTNNSYPQQEKTPIHNATNAPLESSSKKVYVKDPQKEVEEQSTYVSYLVVSDKKQVRRRYQDFVWLHNVLYTHFPACFVPPLPDKHRLEYVKGDRFSQEFVEKRRMSLERFMQRIARHPILSKAELFIKFLEASDFNDASARALREANETMMDTLGDSLLNAFAKIRKPDPRFLEMKERNEKLEENLDMLQRVLARTNKRTEDLLHDYEEFTSSVEGLSDIMAGESPLYKTILNIFSNGLHQFSNRLKTMNTEDTKWQIETHDSMAYYHAVQAVLKLRDQKQLDFEELNVYLHNTMEEKEKLMRDKRGAEVRGVTGYITGMLNEVRGADSQKLKREKILRLDDRVKELQEAIDQTHEVSTAFSEQVKKEDAFFNHNKRMELYDALKTYTNAKVDFYENSISIWREVVQQLEDQ